MTPHLHLEHGLASGSPRTPGRPWGTVCSPDPEIWDVKTGGGLPTQRRQGSWCETRRFKLSRTPSVSNMVEASFETRPVRQSRPRRWRTVQRNSFSGKRDSESKGKIFYLDYYYGWSVPQPPRSWVPVHETLEVRVGFYQRVHYSSTYRPDVRKLLAFVSIESTPRLKNHRLRNVRKFTKSVHGKLNRNIFEDPPTRSSDGLKETSTPFPDTPSKTHWFVRLWLTGGMGSVTRSETHMWPLILSTLRTEIILLSTRSHLFIFRPLFVHHPFCPFTYYLLLLFTPTTRSLLSPSSYPTQYFPGSLSSSDPLGCSPPL